MQLHTINICIPSCSMKRICSKTSKDLQEHTRDSISPLATERGRDAEILAGPAEYKSSLCVPKERIESGPISLQLLSKYRKLVRPNSDRWRAGPKKCKASRVLKKQAAFCGF